VNTKSSPSNTTVVQYITYLLTADYYNQYSVCPIFNTTVMYTVSRLSANSLLICLVTYSYLLL